jgi:hypothetical protein
MNFWAQMLQEAPASLQRLIARSQRISLPRRCSPAERHRRLRQALCHARTVRVTYAQLSADEQAAIQDVRTCRGGLRSEVLEQRYGPVRSWTQLARDPRPQTIAERLILLGWLLPRPATSPRHPARFMVPPEVRRWLPEPLRLELLGPTAGGAALPPAVRVAATLLLTCADRPLPLQTDGTPAQAGLQHLLPRLAPLPAPDATRLCQFVLPLLDDLGLVSWVHGRAQTTPAGQRFLARPLTEQLTRLRQAWFQTPRPDAWLRPWVRDTTGLHAEVLRRRLVAWVTAVPPDQLLDPTLLAARLSATFGPLADADTHGFRHVDRVPWQPRRAAAVFDAALHGPLTWLGWITWHPHPAPAPAGSSPLLLARPAVELPAITDNTPGWQYAAPGMLTIPHTHTTAALFRLLPFCDWVAADATAGHYRITATSLRRARRQGWSSRVCWTVLAEQAGPIPPDWGAELDLTVPTIRIEPALVVTSAVPAVLDRAMGARSVQRAVTERLAPGIALTTPDQAAALVRALERQDIAVLQTPAPPAPAPQELAPGECAALLLACAFYRTHAPPDGPLLVDDRLEQRLRSALSPRLRQTTDAALAELQVPVSPFPEAMPWHPVVPPMPEAHLVEVTPADPPAPGADAPAERDILPAVQQALARRQVVQIAYTTAQGDTSTRIVRPLDLRPGPDTWYLRAYCHTRRAERTFRVDRIVALEPPPTDDGPRTTDHRRRTANSEPQTTDRQSRPVGHNPLTGCQMPADLLPGVAASAPPAAGYRDIGFFRVPVGDDGGPQMADGRPQTADSERRTGDGRPQTAVSGWSSADGRRTVIT